MTNGAKRLLRLTPSQLVVGGLGIGALLVLAVALATSRVKLLDFGIEDDHSAYGSLRAEKVPVSRERSREAEFEAMAVEANLCRERILEAQSKPAFPGAPKLEANRAQLLARGKAEPVLFLEAPGFADEVSPGVEARRRALLRTDYPRDMTLRTIETFRDYPVRLRELLLRDGYLYTDDPATARELTIELSLERLFREPRLKMLRGSTFLDIEKRDDGIYYFQNGPEKDMRARLLVFDRVWLPESDPGLPLHVDVRELAAREGIEGMRVSHLGERHIVAEVRYGDTWVPALLERNGLHVSVDCLQIDPSEAVEVGRERDEAYRRAMVLRAIRSAITTQIREGLPFDEPKTENGQQDGKLRDKWEFAYFNEKSSYTFNGDRYPVYDKRGTPMRPQVCIDFVTETFERASGMYFAPKGEKPERVLGALDFDELLEGLRRQELALRNFARINPHRLEMIDFPQRDWVRYEKVDAFFQNIEKRKDDLRAGDIVIIRGRAAWDRYREIHTHTFFIYESDPVTGMPMLVAGNAGKPRISTWDDEMLRAPKRSIRHRIRPNVDWLYDHVVVREPLRDERWAAPISVTER